MNYRTKKIIGWTGLALSPLLILVSWHFLFGVWFMIGMIWWISWIGWAEGIFDWQKED